MININCDLCGKVEESLSRALIEGVELNVCSNCTKFGKVLAPAKRPAPKTPEARIQKQVEEKEEKIELLVEGYADIIKKRRESIGLAQKDFAKKVNEKESLIHHIETGTFVPSLYIAKKLEKALGVRLIEEYEEKPETGRKNKSEGMTLGDFINTAKK